MSMMEQLRGEITEYLKVGDIADLNVDAPKITSPVRGETILFDYEDATLQFSEDNEVSRDFQDATFIDLIGNWPFVSKDKRVDSEYLRLCLTAVRPSIEKMIHGSKHKYIQASDLAQIKVPIIPVYRQREVVQAFRELGNAIRAKDTEINALDNKHLQLVDDLIVPGETMRRIEEVSQLVQNFNTLIPTKDEDGAYSYITNVEVSRYPFTGITQTERANPKNIHETVFAQPGDVVVNQRCLMAPVEASARAWLGNDTAIVDYGIGVLRAGKDLDPVYFANFFASKLFEDQRLEFLIQNYGKYISNEDLKKIMVPLPPLEQQQEIGRILEEVRLCENSIIRERDVIIEEIVENIVDLAVLMGLVKNRKVPRVKVAAPWRKWIYANRVGNILTIKEIERD